jgi:hypothetical protein
MLKTTDKNAILPPDANIQNIINNKVLTKIELFEPPAKGGGSITGLAQL